MLKKNNYKFSVPILLFCLWALLSYTGMVSQFFLATPSDTLIKLYELFLSGDIFKDLFFTLYRIIAALTIGTIIGLFFGLLFGIFQNLWKYVQGTVDFFRSLPAFALFPFFILIFGPGDKAKIGTTAWFIAFIMMISSAYAIIHANKTRIKAAQILGATKTQIFFKVILPDGLSELMVGFRNALAFGPMLIVATEMFSGTKYGLGDRIYEARLLYNVDEMYATLLIVGFMGYGINKLFLTFFEKKIHWKNKI